MKKEDKMGSLVGVPMVLGGFTFDVTEDPKTFQDVVGHIWGRSCVTIKTDKHMDPLVVFFVPGKGHAINVSPLYDVSKDLVSLMMHQLAERSDVSALALISEAWMVKNPKKSDEDLGSLEDHPDRVEVLSAVIELRSTQGSFHVSAEIQRKDDEVELGETEERYLDLVEGRMTGFFTRGVA